MSLNSQQYANLSDHSYGEEFNGQKGQMQHLVNEDITLEGVTYKILDHMDRPSGYQGTIYQRLDTGEIVVAHRGTEFDREPTKDGAFADGGMVTARSGSLTTKRSAKNSANSPTVNAFPLSTRPRRRRTCCGGRRHRARPTRYARTLCPGTQGRLHRPRPRPRLHRCPSTCATSATRTIPCTTATPRR